MTTDKQGTNDNHKPSDTCTPSHPLRLEVNMKGDSKETGMVFVHSEGRTKGTGSLEVAGRENRRDRLSDESERVNEGTGSHQLPLSCP